MRHLHDCVVEVRKLAWARRARSANRPWARLLPGQGWDDLFPDEEADYLLFNLVLAY